MIITSYLKHYGYLTPPSQSNAPLIPFLLGDAVQIIYTQHIQPLKFTHQLKKYSKDMMHCWHTNNQRLFVALSPEEQNEIIDSMDKFEEYITPNLQSLHQAVVEVLDEIPPHIRNTAAYLTLIVHLSCCASILWRNIYTNVPNTSLQGMRSNAENLFKAYTRIYAHPTGIVDLNNFHTINTASKELCDKILDFAEKEWK